MQIPRRRRSVFTSAVVGQHVSCLHCKAADLANELDGKMPTHCAGLHMTRRFSILSTSRSANCQRNSGLMLLARISELLPLILFDGALKHSEWQNPFIPKQQQGVPVLFLMPSIARKERARGQKSLITHLLARGKKSLAKHVLNSRLNIIAQCSQCSHYNQVWEEQ